MPSKYNYRVCDLGRAVVSLRPDLTFAPHCEGKHPFCVIEDAARSRYFRIGIAEYAFLSFLDGKTTVDEAVRAAAGLLPHHTLSEAQAAGICKWLIDNRLAHVPSAAAVTSSPVDEQERRNETLARWNPLVVRLPLLRPDRLLASLLPWLGWLHSPAAIIASVVLWIAASIHLISRWDALTSATQGILVPDRWLWAAVCFVVVKLVHETSHGLACKKYGGSVREAGLIFILFAPLAYVDISSAWHFRSKWQRIHTSAAGMQAELVLASLAVFVWSAAERGFVHELALDVILLAGFTTLLFNANPLMRFDGYYILSDLLNIPNLYGLGQQRLAAVAQRWLMGQRTPLPAVVGRRAALLTAYGLATLVWRIVVCVTLIVAAVSLLEGLGVVLAVIAAGLWFGRPVLRLVAYLFSVRTWRHARPARLVCFAGVPCTVATAALCLLPWPGAYRAPAIVRFESSTAVRAASAGFLNDIRVVDGQRVRRGEVLAVLSNPDLKAELGDLELAMAIRQNKARVYRSSGRMAAYQAESETLAALKKQHAEKQREVDGLTIRAPETGNVLGRQLRHHRGSYIQKGEEILSVADVRLKQVRISIAQDDVEAFESQLGHRVRFRAPGVPALTCYLDQVAPRATIEPPDPALCAPAGGVLAVFKDEQAPSATTQYDGRLRLVEPRFGGTVRLRPRQSHAVQAGQRGVVTLRLNDRSIGGQLVYVIERWVQRQLEPRARGA